MSLTQPRTRRDFMRLLGLGAAAGAAAVAVPEPVRRFWQVGRDAPFPDEVRAWGENFEKHGARIDSGAEGFWQLMDLKYEAMEASAQRNRELASLYGPPPYGWENGEILVTQVDRGNNRVTLHAHEYVLTREQLEAAAERLRDNGLTTVLYVPEDTYAALVRDSHLEAFAR